MASKANRNRKAFLEWTRRHFPGLYARAAKDASQLNGLGQSDLWGEMSLAQGGPDFRNLGDNGNGNGSGESQKDEQDAAWYDKILSTLEQAVPIYVQADAQKDIMDAQLERAKKGLPPLETSQMAPQVNVGMDPEIQDSITGTANTIQQVALWGGLALGAYFIMQRL